MFTPEFRNRLDAIVKFSQLKPEIMEKIVEKFVDLLEGQLADKGVTIELSNSAKTWFAKKGFEPAYGARPLARVIQENLKKPLAEELLFGELIEGGHIRVDVNNKKIVLEKSKPTKLKKRKKIKT